MKNSINLSTNSNADISAKPKGQAEFKSLSHTHSSHAVPSEGLELNVLVKKVTANWLILLQGLVSSGATLHSDSISTGFRIVEGLNAHFFSFS